MIKLIASDLDETLLDLGCLSDYSKSVLDQLLASDISFVPITARTYEEVDPWFKAHHGIHYCGCSNGAIIVDNHTKKVIVSNEFTSHFVVEVLDAVSSVNPWWSIVIDGKLYSSNAILRDKTYLDIGDEYYQNIIKTRVFIEDYHEVLLNDSKISKIHFITNYPKDKDVLRDALSQFSNQCNIASSHILNIEVNHVGASKGGVIEYLMQLLNLTADEVLAFGDNDNDISMFKVAKTGVAVSSATESLKAIASDICANAAEHGVAKYIEEHLLKSDH